MKSYEKLLEIVNSEADLEEYLADESLKARGLLADESGAIGTGYANSEYLYQLSRIRQNVLGWYDFDPKGSLLEIGAECGALTGLFCEKVGVVVSYEPDENKCSINRTRNKKYTNLTVISHMLSNRNSLGSIVKSSARTLYDYITIIGGFNEEKLEIATSHLKPNGHLIIAVDNKYGICRWSGTKDNSLDNAPLGYDDKTKLYSRKEITEVLKNAGLEPENFYFPTPDFRFPLEVYSEESLPGKNSIKHATPSFDQDKILSLNEPQMIDQLIEDGLFEDFANSYVIISRNNQKNIETVVDNISNVVGTSNSVTGQNESLLYVKYNSTRRPEYQLSTEIREVYELRGKIRKKRKTVNKYVTKKPITSKAVSQIKQIEKNYESLQNYYNNIEVLPFKVEQGEIGSNALKRPQISFEYVDGESVLAGLDFEKDSLDTIYSRLKKEMNILFDIREDRISDFVSTADFEKVFPGKQVSGKAVKPCNFDTIFSNFIRVKKNKSDEKDSIICIDYEWVWDFPVPINFLKYRMIHYLYEENESYLANRVSFEDFVSFLNLSDDELKTYAAMELDFQHFAHGENLRYIYTEGFKRRMLTSEKAFQLIDSKDTHICNLEAQMGELRDAIEDLKEYNQKQESKLIKTSDELADHIAMVQNRDEQIQSQNEYIQSLEGRVAFLTRCIKNPFYGLYSVFRRGPASIRRRLDEKKAVKAAEEKARLDELRFKELLDITEGDYQSWIERREAKYEARHDSYDQKLMLQAFSYAPKISIVIPVYNVEDRHLLPCIDSVKAQTYSNWELILVDDCSTLESVGKTLKKLERKYRRDPRFIIKYREENGGISNCTNTGIEMATGDYIAFMDCDDTIAPFALYEVVKMLNSDNNGESLGSYDFVYSDEDKLSDDGTRRHSPFFKPDWSPDTLMSYMYTSHLGVYRTDLVKELGGLRSEYDGCQDYDLTLRFTEKTNRIGHISKILYHWRERDESTALSPESKSYIKERVKKMKEDTLERRGLTGEVEWLEDIYQYRVKYIPKDNPLVSIVIPSKDNPDILTQCLTSLTDITNYRNYEIIVVDNGSNDENRAAYQKLLDDIKREKNLNTKYLYAPKDFNFSFMCNIGARSANGEYLLFLNDDIEIINSEWLERMVGATELPQVGAVGAKLLYPDTTLIQHAGVISIESGPVHEFARMDDTENYYFNRNRLDFDTLAVTAACLLVKKTKFEEVGLFDEELAVAYNDVDLCFKLAEKGYHNVIRNDVILYHHESISRGDDAMDPEKFARLMREQDKLYDKHPEYKRWDPYYNVNLVQTDCDFSINYDGDSDYGFIRTEVSKYKADDTIRYGIDVARYDWCVYIEGWAFKTGFNDNINLDTKIVLVGEKVSYVLNTVHVRREDVVETFSDENCITFCGFKSRISRGALEPGTYDIQVLVNNQISGNESFAGDEKITLQIN